MGWLKNYASTINKALKQQKGMATQSAIPKVILDTDPGGDDIFALFWLQSLAKQGLVEIAAVTTAEGNVSARKTFSSACQVLALGGFHSVEIGRGVPVPGKSGEDAAHIHGADGMGNLSTTLPVAAYDYETAHFSDDILIEQLTAAPGEVTLVAVAPLTNLASAEKKCPGILKKAKELVIMGGAFHCPGNVTPHAEFNIWYNPDAAAIVFDSRDDCVVIPLDVTRHLIFTRAMAQAVSQKNSEIEVAQFLSALCEFMIGTALGYRETGGLNGFLVHDAATLAYLFYPEVLKLQRANVSIEVTGEWTLGQTLIDSRPRAKTRANAWVASQVDEAQFFTNLVEDLKVLINSFNAF